MRCPILQVKRAENQTRPTVLVEPAPGGVWYTVVALSLNTGPNETNLDIDACLGALAAGAPGAEVDVGIRVLVDGVSPGLGSSETFTATPNEELVNLAILCQVTVQAGVHLVELQWYSGCATSETLIGFVNAELDGAAMRVMEVSQ